MSVTLFNTNSVTEKDQFSYWNDAICNTFTSLNCQPPETGTQLPTGYSASLENWDLGNLQISQVTADPAVVDHGFYQVAASSEEVDLVHFQISGTSLNIQDDREAFLRPGEFTICNSSRPYSLFFDKTIEMLVIRIPHELTQKYFSNKQSMYGFHFSAPNAHCTGRIFSDYLMNLWNHRNASWSETQMTSVSSSALSLLTSHLDSFKTLGAAVDGRSEEGTFKSIQLYIDNNLGDPELCPESIASAHHISARSLRNKFAAKELTCSGYIFNRRLTAAQRYLSEKHFADMKIIEIAFLCGFQSASHFSNRFREAFGSTPKDYRAKHLH